MQVYYSKRTLGIRNEERPAVLKGERVEVYEVFVDRDHVRCADAKVNGRRLSIPLSYLTAAPDPTEPPHEERETSTFKGILGSYGTPPGYKPREQW